MCLPALLYFKSVDLEPVKIKELKVEYILKF